ncbi:MAG: DUF2970 domain-containing protein [Rhodocyclaceae bacterium]|nr:DUF2970 domain-containing protein [Rhodocyclaceae bacterium]MBK9624336.1 DUF2970 domain-containing protein [Rhodocyclaceae bacterium]MBL0074917.1 DUF2970 domain-containing protein [Rhodocyclaceae bacterium]MBP6109286.1 DUF2970 domain-containing protein [Rhodocyclaceae bacterium]MBP6278533.1 DUF2970 domain-containing protein [Rhodocyclaceae bacterium]
MKTTPEPQAVSSLWRVLRTVGSGMVGLRGRAAHAQDAPSLSPVHLIIAAVVFMLIFVATMVTIATLVVGK